EIERAKQEAESHAEEDRVRKEGVETKNQAETMVYQVEKSLADLGDKVPAEQKQPITDKVDALKKAIADDDTAAMKTQTDELQKLFAEAYQHMAQAGGAPEGGVPQPQGDAPEGATEAPKDKGKVVDADFEVVDSDKKG
ncbi:MAG: Hsp70 family protein, partial [Verrucomicrobium sp.]